MSSSPAALHRRRLIAKYTRWLHIYGSMGSFAIVFFFAVTGLTLNHPQWFARQQRRTTVKGSLDASWVHTATDADVKKLEVVERLRSAHGIHAALAEFRIDDRECDVTFKGPGYSADAFIDRATGAYELTESRMGWGAIINDLHKGRDTGDGWRVFIDVSAVLLTFVSLTGLLLIWFVHKHRIAGLLFLGAGALVSYMAYAVWAG